MERYIVRYRFRKTLQAAVQILRPSKGAFRCVLTVVRENKSETLKKPRTNKHKVQVAVRRGLSAYALWVMFLLE